MAKQSRRKFLSVTALLCTGLPLFSSPLKSAKAKKQLTHHVFFWLKNPKSKEDLDKLVEGLKTLRKIETVRKIHIGIPASTEVRDVVDNSFSASELLFFNDLAGQKTYQDHPIHQKFIENCSHLWSKVIVYDSMDL